MRRSLTKNERLRGLTEIKTLFASGKRVSCPGARLVYRDNHLEYSRFMVTLVKKYGNSVSRNRAKRVAREIYRNGKNRLVPGYDLILVLYPDQDDYRNRENQMQRLFEKASLCAGGGENKDHHD